MNNEKFTNKIDLSNQLGPFKGYFEVEMFGSFPKKAKYFANDGEFENMTAEVYFDFDDISQSFEFKEIDFGKLQIKNLSQITNLLHVLDSVWSDGFAKNLSDSVLAEEEEE